MSIADKIDKIEKVRETNNFCWMNLVRLVLRKAPEEAKPIIRQIAENDKKVWEVFSKIADEL